MSMAPAEPAIEASFIIITNASIISPYLACMDSVTIKHYSSIITTSSFPGQVVALD